MRKIKTILWKEWEEVFQTRIVLWTVIGTPLLFVALAVGTLAFSADLRLSEQDAAELGQFTDLCGDDAPASECVTVYMGVLYLSMFLMLPAILPGVIAAYSIVGEKTSRTLEPLLATPITSAELLVGKCVAAVLPAVAATWVAAILYYVGVAALAPLVLPALLAPEWLLALGLLGPLVAVFAVQAAIMVSSRVEDPRTAQQVSGLIVLPLVGVLMGQSFGLFVVDATLVSIAVVVMLAVCAVSTWLTVQLFEREAILTRWK